MRAPNHNTHAASPLSESTPAPAPPTPDLQNEPTAAPTPAANLNPACRTPNPELQNEPTAQQAELLQMMERLLAESANLAGPNPAPDPASVVPVEQSGTEWNTPEPPSGDQNPPQLPIAARPARRNKRQIPDQLFHTPPDPRLLHLHPKQQRALELILAGLPDARVAKALGVSRTTLYRWRNFHPGFAAELSQRRLDAWHAVHDRLRHLLPRALDALAKGLKSADPHVAIRAAAAVLARTAPDPKALPPDPRTIEPQDVVDAYAAAFRRNPDRPITPEDRRNANRFLLAHAFEPAPDAHAVTPSAAAQTVQPGEPPAPS